MSETDKEDVFFEGNPNPMWIYKPETLKINAVNKAAIRFYGFSREEMLSMTLKDLRPPGEVPKLQDEINKGKQDFNDAGIWLHQKKNKEPVYVRILSYPIAWNGENCKLVVAQDVTRQKDLEQDYLAEQELLDVLVQNMPGTFYIFDREGRMLRWNRRVSEITGYSDKKIEKMSPLDFFSAEEKNKVREAVEEAFAKGYGEIQANLITGNKKKIPFFFRAGKVNIHNKPHLIGLGTDISSLTKAEQNRKTAEKKLQEQYKKEKEERLRIELINNRLKLLEKVGNIFAGEHEGVKSALEKTAKVLTEEVADICTFDILESDSLKRVVQEIPDPEKKKIAVEIRSKYPDFFYNLDLLKGIIKSGNPVLKNNFTEKDLKEQVENSDQFEMISQLGVRSFFILPLKVQDQVLGVVTLIILNKEREFVENDISFLTELANKTALHIENSQINEKLKDFNRELETQVKERTRQLENINEELESFSYSVSHDLRAPLRAISGYTNLLQEDYQEQLEEDGKQFLSIIKHEAHRMGNLIDDLLAFSRLNRSGKSEKKFSMRDLVKQCVDDVIQSDAAVKPEVVVKELPQVYGDPKMLRQVWLNLIGNSIKYRKKDQIPHIIIGHEKEKKHDIFYIKDDGVGFNMKYADKLFGVFQRLHSDDEFEGTGIGLALARRIINRHGGDIWAESEVNKGSTFYFSLPNINSDN